MLSRELNNQFDNFKENIMSYVLKLEKEIKEKDNNIYEKNYKIGILEMRIKELEDKLDIINTKYSKSIDELKNIKFEMGKTIENYSNIKEHTDVSSNNKVSEVSKNKKVSTVSYPDKLSYVITEVNLINDPVTICPKCYKTLGNKRIDVAYFNIDKNKPKGYMEYELLYCEKCNCAYVDKEFLELMQKESEPDIISYYDMRNKSCEEVESNTSDSRLEIKVDEEDDKSNCKPTLENISQVFLIKNKVRICPFGKLELKNHNLCLKECNLDYFSGKKNKLKKGSLTVKLFYCEECKRYFINQEIMNKVREKLGEYRIEVIAIPKRKTTTKKKISSAKLKKNLIVTSAKIYKRFGSVRNDPAVDKELNIRNARRPTKQLNIRNATTAVKQQEKHNDNYSLNDVSKLGEMGYSVRKDRSERWDILLKAVAKLGAYQVKSHLEWLIRLKRSDKTKDNSNSILEWEYDLKRLNQWC